jgi:hypothetical protein
MEHAVVLKQTAGVAHSPSAARLHKYKWVRLRMCFLGGAGTLLLVERLLTASL